MIRRSICLIVAILLAACEVVDIGPAGPTPTRGSIVAATGADWYRVYFTDPPDQDNPEDRPAEAIDDYVTASITAARRTVDAATYDFNLPSMADALIEAQKRGLVVRLVTDTDTMPEEQVQRIVDSDIPVVDDGRSAIMHDKFVIVDGLVVWTGSWNFSQNDTYRNNNNLIGIVSPNIVANFQVVFNSMFEQRQF